MFRCLFQVWVLPLVPWLISRWGGWHEYINTCQENSFKAFYQQTMVAKNKPHLNLPAKSPPVCMWYRINAFHICWERAQPETVSHETLQVYIASSQNDQGSEDVLIFSDALTAPRVDRRRLHTRPYKSTLVILKNSTSGLSTPLIPRFCFPHRHFPPIQSHSVHSSFAHSVAVTHTLRWDMHGCADEGVAERWRMTRPSPPAGSGWPQRKWSEKRRWKVLEDKWAEREGAGDLCLGDS